MCLFDRFQQLVRCRARLGIHASQPIEELWGPPGLHANGLLQGADDETISVIPAVGTPHPGGSCSAPREVRYLRAQRQRRLSERRLPTVGTIRGTLGASKVPVSGPFPQPARVCKTYAPGNPAAVFSSAAQRNSYPLTRAGDGFYAPLPRKCARRRWHLEHNVPTNPVRLD